MMALTAASSRGQCLVFSEESHGRGRELPKNIEEPHVSLVGSSPGTEFHLKAISNHLMIQPFSD